MNFDEFKTTYINENKKLKTALALTLILTTLTTLSVAFQHRYFIYKGKSIFEERPTAVEVCKLSFESLAKGEPNSYLVTDEIIDLVEKEPFSLKVDKILKLESLEKNFCKIILKSDGDLLSFKISLKESSFFPFHYKLIQLDQLAINKGEKK